MRQAGRYLPEYNATRRKAGSFLALAQTPELACEVTLQPIERFALDAAIIFSDILTVPDAMGLGLHFVEGEGPKFERPLRAEKDIAALAVPDSARLRYVFDAIAMTRKALGGRVPLIGFSGSPFTLACYMVEGGGSEDFRQVKTLLYSRPDLLHRILAVNAAAVTSYLNEQIAAGAQAVMIFDTWGGALSHAAFEEFSLAYSRRVLAITRTHEGVVPRVLFTKGGGGWPRRWPIWGRRSASTGRLRSATRARVAPGRAAGQPRSDGFFAPPEAIEREAARFSTPSSGSATFQPRHGVYSTRPRARRGARRGGPRAPSGPTRAGGCQENICADVIAFTRSSFSGVRSDIACALSEKPIYSDDIDAAAPHAALRTRTARRIAPRATYAQTYPQFFLASRALFGVMRIARRSDARSTRPSISASMGTSKPHRAWWSSCSAAPARSAWSSATRREVACRRNACGPSNRVADIRPYRPPSRALGSARATTSAPGR